MKAITLSEFLTAEEIARAQALWSQLKDTGHFAAVVEREIIAPQLARINRALGHANDPRHLADAVEDEFSTADDARPGYLWDLVEDTCKVCGKHLGTCIRFLRIGLCETCGNTTH